MPSQLVVDVRRRITDEGRPLTALERALLLATLAHRPQRGGEDVIDELEAAIRAARMTLSDQYAEHRVAALKRLLAASRAVLDYLPDDPTYDPHAHLTPQDPDRRVRADVDG